jgi:hypothetical protein
MQSIVINTCYGGFGLSDEAEKLYFQKNGIETTYNNDLLRYVDNSGNDLCTHGICRTDPILVEVVTELGENANGRSARLKIIQIPIDIDWIIQDHDGKEWVAETHRRWR